MFSVSEAVLLSFLFMTVASSPKPAAEDFTFDPDIALWGDSSPAEPLDHHDLLSSASTDLFNSDPSPASNIAPDSDVDWDQEDSFASNTGTGQSCRAEDIQLLPAIGKLRARRGSESEPGKTTCASPGGGQEEDPAITKFRRSWKIWREALPRWFRVIKKSALVGSMASAIYRCAAQATRLMS